MDERQAEQDELERLYKQFDAIMPVNARLWRRVDLLRDLNERITLWKEAQERMPWAGYDL